MMVRYLPTVVRSRHALRHALRVYVCGTAGAVWSRSPPHHECLSKTRKNGHLRFERSMGASCAVGPFSAASTSYDTTGTTLAGHGLSEVVSTSLHFSEE